MQEAQSGKEITMARFYGDIRGDKGQVTRMGHKTISGHIRGWDTGVFVHCGISDKGDDECLVYATGGSNKAKGEKLIAVVTKNKVSRG